MDGTTGSAAGRSRRTGAGWFTPPGPASQPTGQRLAAVWVAAVGAPGAAAGADPGHGGGLRAGVGGGLGVGLFPVRDPGPAAPGPAGRGRGHGLTSWDGGISGAVPLAGGAAVAVLAAAEPTAADKRRKADRDDAVAWEDRVPRDRLWLLDLGTGGLAEVGGLAGRHAVEVVQRPGGGPLAVIAGPARTSTRAVISTDCTWSTRPPGRCRTSAGRNGWRTRPSGRRAADGWHLCFPGEGRPHWAATRGSSTWRCPRRGTGGGRRTAP